MEKLQEIIDFTKDLTILYVEDDDTTREYANILLADFFKKIITAENGKIALEKFKENKVDLIITDINMPEMNGIEFIREIKKIDQDVPIMVVTAHNEAEYFIECIGLGVDGYLLKPIDFEQFVKELYKVLLKYKYRKEAKENLHFLEIYKQATNLSAIVSKTDPKGNITYVNDAFCEISGYSREELIGKPHNIVRHPDMPKEVFEEIWNTIKSKKIWRGIVRNRRKDGKSYYVDSLIMPIEDLDGNIIEFISIRHDITDVMSPVRLFKDAFKNFNDPTIVYMKLENFDILEEFYDTEIIDKIQAETKKYLTFLFSQVYEFDQIYHLGNGECAFLIDYRKYHNSAEEFIEFLKEKQKEIREKVLYIGDIRHDVAVLMSVVYEGDKRYESAKAGIKTLLKTGQKFIIANNLAVEMQKKAKENYKTIQKIKKALEENKIVSYFQPIVDNNTKEFIKYESLVRLVDEDGKVLSPFFFLDVAKTSNYYIPITKKVLDSSFNAAKKYNIEVSINISVIDIENKQVRDFIYKNVKDIGNLVTFELLEDEGIKDFELVKEFIQKVKSYGIKIAIDDFGSGYSNYERLIDYEPDILKIDGSLIKNIETTSYSQSLVKNIVNFAKEQNIKTVAEFVENENIYKILKDFGVDYSQGYYFGKPDLIENYIK